MSDQKTPPGPPGPPKTDALAAVTGTSSDADRITQMLQQAAERFHVVSPVTSCPSLPEGMSVATSAVMINAAETYAIPGSDKVGISKSGLDRIAMAVGLVWDSRESRRLDDSADPFYCSYLAVGHFPNWDGSRGTTQATKEVDLRDGAPAVTAMWERYKQKLAEWERGGKQGYQPKSPEAQLREARLHVQSMAESKAKNRAVRALGVRTSYSKQELATKPFICARAIFTGETADPDLRREFALMRAQAFFGAHKALYGTALAAPQLPPGRPAPLVGTVVDHDEDGVLEGEIVEEPQQASAPATTPVPASPAAPAQPAPSGAPPAPAASSSATSAPQGEPAQTPATQSSSAARAAASGFAIPGGRSRGKPLEEADDQDLTYWGGRLEQELSDGTGKPQFRDRNAALLEAIRAEQGRRAGGDEDDDVREGIDFDTEGFARGDEDDSTSF